VCYELYYVQRKLEDELERKRRQLRDQAAIIKEKANDINKANEIIGRLQTDNMAFHSEVYMCINSSCA